MIDKERLKEYLAGYKRDFPERWWEENEKFKWEAVQYFQDRWDVNAADFPSMLSSALEETSNLLASANHYPRGMIEQFAKAAPEKVRAMFLALYDEGRDVYERIEEFKSRSDVLLEQHGDGAAHHFQSENAITTYLWLRYPDKYYIYKYGEIRNAAGALGANYTFKKGAYRENIRNFLSFYNELREALSEDEGLIQLLCANLTEKCWKDTKLHTLAIDVEFYISRLEEAKKQDAKQKETSAAWFPQEYDPGLTREDWAKLLRDPNVFTSGALEIMKRIQDCGGEASCTQLAETYGETKNFYNSGSVALAKRVAQAKQITPQVREDGTPRWWSILYVGRNTEKEEVGSFIWKLRPELAQALDRADLSGVALSAAEKSKTKATGYWWLNANPKMWSFSSIAINEEKSYTLYNENRHKRRIFQNFLDARAGDRIIGYESYPVKKIVALGRICAEQDGEQLRFEKTESLTAPIGYDVLKACPELENMEYFQNPQGSLFKLTQEEYNFILDLVRDQNPLAADKTWEPYTREDFLREVYMTDKQYDTVAALLKRKKNLILQGAPGVGKTFAARRLAYSIMGEKDEDRVEQVQFHQNYSYEDFVMGYKPTETGFELRNGIFYTFCQKAADQPDKDFFFLIDEINRGNLSKIFGELLMLMERDYRGEKVTLSYNGMSFAVPENVYIIGMMNTADRSLAMIDYALRRRFSFVELEPGFDSDGFAAYQKELNSETLDELIRRVKALNQKIAGDRSLGKGFCIGHSYFCAQSQYSEDWLREVVEYDLIPTLQEYWFDDPGEVQRWSNSLRGVFQ